MRTDPALSSRRKPLKPLLAAQLAGEPWAVALREPRAMTSGVLAAAIASYVSRRAADWDRWTGGELADRLKALTDAEHRQPEHAPWPFFDALVAALPWADWTAIDRLLEPHRRLWRLG